MNLQPQTKKIVINAALTALVGGLMTKYVLQDEGNVIYFGMEVSSPVAIGMASGIGSITGDLISDQVIRRLKLSNQLFNSAEMAVHIGVSGSAATGILWFNGLPMSAVPKIFALGAASKLVGDYANDKLFDPRNGMIALPF